MNAKPLHDFRETLDAVFAQLKTDLKPPPDVEARIDRRIELLRVEFDRLFDRLAGYAASEFQRDRDGDTVMLSPAEARTRAESRAAAQVGQPEEQPYARFTSSSDPATYKLLEQMFTLLGDNGVLLRDRLVLTRDAPHSQLSPHVDEPEQSGHLAMSLYLRNKTWMSMFSGGATSAERALFDLDDMTRALWREYARRRIDGEAATTVTMTTTTTTTTTATTTATTTDRPTVNALDALFAPIRVIDYSPEQLAVAIQARRLVRFYQEIVQEQAGLLRRSLDASLRARTQQEFRLLTLQREEIELLRRKRELRDELRAVEVREKSELMTELARANRDETERADRLLAETRRAMERVRVEVSADPRAEQRRTQFMTYRHYLYHTYLERETTFLGYLTDLLRRRRDNKRFQRLLNPSYRNIDYIARQPTLLGGTQPIKQYLRERDNLLQRLYRLERPFTPPSSSSPPSPLSQALSVASSSSRSPERRTFAQPLLQPPWRF